MKIMMPLALALAFASSTLQAQAPTSENDAPGHARGCAACHGENGVSVDAAIPNLAAQRPAYLASQLRAYRSGARENALMNAVAASLSDAEIEALAQVHAEMPGPPEGSATSPYLPELVRTEFPFPSDYESTFLRYRTTYPGNQVRHLYANDTAVAAARAGRPLPDGSYVIVEIFAAQLGADGQPVRGGDGQLVAGERIGFNVMAREPAWGDSVPQLLRNENWQYANLAADGSVNAAVNQAACLACHLPLAEDSFLFTIEQLNEAARAAGR